MARIEKKLFARQRYPRVQSQRRAPWLIVGLVVIMFLIGCKDQKVLDSVTVTPADQTLGLYSAPVQYTATGNYSDGSTKDLTTTVVWSIDSTADTLFSTAVKGLLIPNREGSFIILGTFKVTDSSSDVVGYTSLKISP